MPYTTDSRDLIEPEPNGVVVVMEEMERAFLDVPTMALEMLRIRRASRQESPAE
jgi:hypothetical protein